MLRSRSSIHHHPLPTEGQIHLVRKAWHIGAGLLGLAIYYWGNLLPHEAATIALALAAFDFLIEFLRLRYAGLNQLFIRFFRPIIRDSERTGLSGFSYYALGLGLAFMLYSEPIALLSILFLIFADPFSSYFGVLYGGGRNRNLGHLFNGKSLQGSTAGFVVCYLLSFAYGLAYDAHGMNLLIFAVLAGFVGPLSEMLSTKRLNDNLTIPVLSGLGLTFLNLFFKIFN